MRVDGSLISLIQGVSQQPPRERRPGQSTLQENFSSNPVTSLTRRPPTEYINDLLNDEEVSYWTDFIDFDGTHYVVAVAPSGLRIFDLDGAEYSVSEGTGSFDYLTGGTIVVDTVEDNIVILDTGTETAMLADLPVYSEKGGLIHLLGGQYGRTYSIPVTWPSNSVTVSYVSPDGSVAAHGAQVATDYIATQLEAALNANATFTGTFNVSRVSDVLYITWDTPGADDFSLTVSDGDGGANIFAMTTRIGDPGKLPRYAPHGYVITVTGQGDASADDWYLQFLVDDDKPGHTVGTGFGSDGVWRECTKPGEKFKLDPATMPHVLVPDGMGGFTFDQASWEERRAGDDNTRPIPSFIGNTLNDLCTFQSRLTVGSGKAVVMSRTKKYFDFFCQSATVLAEDDPIDVESTAKTKGVVKMEQLIPHNRDLVVFSRNAQFIIFGRNALTPQNAALVLTTAFEANLGAAAQSAGRNVFFASNYGAYTSMREFFTEGSADINDARPITQHVSEYLTGKATLIVASPSFELMLVRTDTSSTSLYAYEYLWVEDQGGLRKAQSSWSTWIFSDPVQYGFFDESVVYWIMNDGGRYYITKMNLDIQKEVGLSYQVKLDNKFPMDDVELAIPMPYPCEDRDLVFVQGPGCPEPGMTVRGDPDEEDPSIIVLRRDMGGGTVYVGEKFLSRYKPTMPQIKDENDVKIGTGTLTVRQFLIQFQDSGYMRAIITTPYADPTEVKFTGRVLGSPDNVVGEPAISSGKFSVPFRHDADQGEIEIQCDSHLNLQMLDIEWEGQYRKRGRRMMSGGQ
jgi:hypothetical protein